MKLKVEILVKSKMAAHVPVFRKWKLVWERREFGTRTDREQFTFDLPELFGIGADKVLSQRAGDLEALVKLSPKLTGNGTTIQTGRVNVSLALKFKGFGPFEILERDYSLPALKWEIIKTTEIYKGVKATVTAEIVS